jgi:crossover junction endodeoxyribonuclease RuvC
MITILGIDPGSRVTGFGIIGVKLHNLSYLNSGCIRMRDTDLPGRLQQIFDGITELMRHYQPDEVAVEQVFMNTNAAAALKLGQARGAAIVAAAIHAVPVAEYSARQVKQAVVGYGAAEKSQIQDMIVRLLKLNKAPPSDAADALAVAVCHAHSRTRAMRVGEIK